MKLHVHFQHVVVSVCLFTKRVIHTLHYVSAGNYVHTLATTLCAISTVNSLPLGAATHQFDSNTPQTLNLGLVRGLFFF